MKENEICQHDWEKWSSLKYYWNHIWIQQRHCKKCGIGQISSIKLEDTKSEDIKK